MPDPRSNLVDNGPARRPGRRRRLLIWLLVLGVLATVTVWLATRGRIAPWLQSRIERALATATGGRATFESIELELLPLELNFTGLHVDAGAPDARLTVSVATGRVRLAWRDLPALLAGRVRLAELAVVRPAVSIDRDYLAGLRRTSANGAGKPGPVADLRFGRLEIVDGTLDYADRIVPIAGAAERVELRADWGTFRRALIGSISAHLELEQSPLGKARALEGSVSFKLRGSRLEFDRLDLDLDGLRLREGAGHVVLARGAPLALRGEVEADLARLPAWLDGAEAIPASGVLRGELFAEGDASGVHVTGNLGAPDLSIGALELANASAHLDLADGLLRIGALEARTLGGAVEGSANVAFGSTRSFDLRLDARDVDLGAALAIGGLELPLASRGRVSVAFQGDPLERESWQGRGTVESLPDESQPERIPLGAAGAFALSGMRLTTVGMRLSSPATTLRLDLDAELARFPATVRTTVHAEFADLQASQLEALTLTRALGLEPPALLDAPVTGRGRIDATYRADGETTLHALAELEQGGWWGYEFVSARVELTQAGEWLELRELEIEGAGWQLAGQGRFSTDELRLEQLDAEMKLVPLGPIWSWIGTEQVAAGLASGRVSLERGPSGLDGAGELQVSELQVAGETLERVSGEFTVERDFLTIPALLAQGPAIELQAYASVDPNGDVAGRLERLQIGIDRLDILQRLAVDAEGELLVAGELFVTAGRPAARLTLTGTAWNAEGIDIGDVGGELRIDETGLGFQLISGERYGVTIEGRLGWDEQLPLITTVHLDGTTVEPQFETAGDLWARVSGQFVVEGSAAAPESLRATGSFEEIELQVGDSRLIAAAVPLELADQRLHVGPLRLTGAGSDFRTDVRFAFGGEGLDAESSGTLDAAVVTALWPQLRAGGPLHLDLRARGAVEQPVLEGSVRWDEGHLRILGFPEPLGNVDLSLRLSGERIELEQFRARIGGGEIQGSGGMEFAGLQPRDFQAQLDLANVGLSYPEGFRGVYEGRLGLSGNASGITCSGELHMLRGLYDRKFKVTELLGYGSREFEARSRWQLPVEVFLDVAVTSEGNVWVRNKLAELENRLDLHFGGTVNRPEITGRIWVEEGGTIRFRNVDYRVETGSLDLLELQRINPYIDLTADTEVNEYRVVLRVEGTLDDLDYQLTSDPPLSPPDIIALLTTGQTLENLNTAGSAGGKLFATDAVGTYFAGALLEPQLQRWLGIDRVRIDPFLVDGQTDPTTRVTLGKQVGDSVLVSTSVDVESSSDDPLYQIEWQASRRFRVVARRNTDGAWGGDIRYTKRYWLNNRPGEAHDPTPLASSAEPQDDDRAEAPPIASIAIHGVSSSEEAALLAELGFSNGAAFRRSRMLEGAQRLQHAYVRQGRLEARIDAEAFPTAAGGMDVVYTVDPGGPVEIEITGVGKKDRKRMTERLSGLWYDPLFETERYREAERELLEYLHEQGYYAADVIHRVASDESGKRLEFLVDTGPVVRVSAVKLTGVAELDEAQVRRQLLTLGSGLFTAPRLVPEVLEDDLSAIRALYHEHGFLRVEVDPPRIRMSGDGTRATVTIPIREGPQFVVGRVSVSAALPVPQERVVEWSGLKPGQPVSPGGLLEAEHDVGQGLDGHGYPEVRVVSDLEIHDDARVDVTFTVDPGGLKRLGEVTIRGNQRIKERVITREIDLQTGDPISRDELLQTQHRLYKTGVFRSVRLHLEPLAGEDPSLQRLVVDVSEGPPLGVLLGLGFDTEAGLKGTFSISHNSPGGRDRQMAIQGTVSSIQRRLQWLTEDKRLFGVRTLRGLGTVFWEEKEQVSFDEQRTSLAARVEKDLTEHWIHYLRYSLQNVNLSNVQDIAAVQRQKLQDLRLGDLGYALIRDDRDDPFSPTHGSYLSGEFRYFAPIFLSEQRFFKTYIRGSSLLGFSNDTQFYTAARVGIAWPLDSATRDAGIPISERYFAGGSSTIRGFPQDGVGPRDPITDVAIGGQAVFILNEEYRFPIWKALRGEVFYDLGNVYDTARDMDLTDLRHVLGLGLRVNTPLGPLRLEYGWKLDREPGESAGQFYFAIGNMF